MGTVLGCIADDFTGATDLAALLARSGVPVSLRIGVPSATLTGETAAFEVIALKCRTSPVDEARADSHAALAWLRQSGATRFFWKYCSTFDSTASGNIGPVAEMLMAELGVAQTIYCPAFPQNGRSVFMGHLFVGRQLLSDSPMKDHPLTPMRHSDLTRLLAPQVRGRAGLIDRTCVARGAVAVKQELQDLAEQGVAHVVVDAVADEDLAVIAGAVADMVLVTGGSAIAGQLARLYAGDEQKRPAPSRQGRPAGGQLVLAGSCSAMTRKQVGRYSEKAASLHLDPVALASDGGKAACAWLRQRAIEEPKLIFATAEPEAVRKAQETLGARAGQVVEQALADLAREAFDLGIRRFVIAGGETAGAVTAALGVARLEIGDEIAPGVPWTFAEIGGQTVALALKSGNFGGEDFFQHAFDMLEAA